MSRKAKKFVAALLVLAVASAAWEWVVKPRTTRYQSWAGTLEDAYRLYDPTKYTYEPHRAEHKDYNHFWRIACDDGETREVKMPYALWAAGRIGEEVVKVSGELWPRMVNQGDVGDVLQHVEADERDNAPLGPSTPEPTEAPMAPPAPQ
ncbi:MAG TPA: hypothetical protein ENN80_12580 [Candidatus Hydrogenedentes bacterium]|nr:hypothetical protein [Candidatus Hydrogenedentota bacterium]